MCHRFCSCSAAELQHVELKLVKRQNDDWNECIDNSSIVLGRCIIDCNENHICEAECLKSFKNEHNDCPCEVRA